MKPDYWIRQPANQPAYPDMLWSRPENKLHAGKLLVAGGNSQGFAAPAEAYASADKAGAGTIRLLLPEAIRRYIGLAADDAEFVPTTPSGSFSQQSLALLLEHAQWADAVLLAGNFGKNSETAILLEKFADKYHSLLGICGDAIDYFIAQPQLLLDRPNTLLGLEFSQLQKLAVGAHFPQAFTSQLDLLHFVGLLHEFQILHTASLLIRHLGYDIVAAEGRISTTAARQPGQGSLLDSASRATVWWLQHPGKPFQAMTTALAS